jgi:hypothetical protein
MGDADAVLGSDSEPTSAAVGQERAISPAVPTPELQPEPAEGSANVSAMVFRMPSGERVSRRFDGARTLQDAFDYLHVAHGSESTTVSSVHFDMCKGFLHDAPSQSPSPGPSFLADNSCSINQWHDGTTVASGSYSMAEGFPPKKHEDTGHVTFVDAGLVGRVQVNISSK